jgi:hypothetical protein
MCCLSDSGDIYHVPLDLVPYEDFALGVRLCGDSRKSKYGASQSNAT